MDEFYRRIRKNVKSRPELEFQEKAWENMQARMQQPVNPPVISNKGVDKKWLFLLALLLLGSLLFNSWFFFQSEGAKGLFAQANLLQVDTIVKTNVIYQRDTIYLEEALAKNTSETRGLYPNYSNTRYPLSQQKNYSNPFTAFNTLLTNTHRSEATTLSNLTNMQQAHWQNYISNQLSRMAIPTDGSNNDKNTSGNLVENLKRQPFSLKTILLQKNELQKKWNLLNPVQLGDVTLVAAYKKKMRMRDHLQQIRPKNIMLGINGGFVYSSENTLKTKDGLIGGLDVVIVFSEKLRLFSEFNFVRSFYKTNQMGDHVGVPVIPSPNAEYEFSEARVSLSSLQYSVGFKYLFHSKHKFRPYIGLGLTGVSIRPSEIAYKFIKDIDDLELTVDSEVERTEFLTNHLLFKTGLEYQLKKHWSLQANGFYRYQLKFDGFTPPDLFGIRGGLLYSF